MKRTVFIVVLLVLSIGIPVLAESSDSLSTESENPVLQKQELKLPWYKNMNYTLGYNNDSSLLTSGSPSKDTLKGKGIPFWRKLSYEIGYSRGFCYSGKDLAECSPTSGLLFPFYWLNSIEVSAIYPLEKGKGIEVGIEYGWARIEGTKGWFKVVYTEDDTMHLHGWYSASLSSFTFSIAQWNKDSRFRPSFGISTIIAKGSENRGETWFAVKRVSIGITPSILVSFPIHIRKNLSLSPFLSLKFSLFSEVWNNSPWDEYWDKTLTVSEGGLYGGIRLNIGGGK